MTDSNKTPTVDFIIRQNGDATCEQFDTMKALCERLKSNILSPLTEILGETFRTTLELIPEECDEEMLSFQGHVRYCGSFHEVSNPFDIWVKRDSQMDKTLNELVNNNTATKEYIKAFMAKAA